MWRSSCGNSWSKLSGGSPMSERVRARLIGGRADGLVCSLPERTSMPYITMIDGAPCAFPTGEDPAETKAVLNAANGWDGYTLISGLAPDEQGRVGYWC